MSEAAKQAVKKEEADEDLEDPISAFSQKPLKKESVIHKNDLDDDDDVPIALSKARKKSSSKPPKVKKEEPEDDEDDKPLKKMDSRKKVSRPLNMKKEAPCDSEEEEANAKTEKKGKKRKRTEVKKKVAGKAKKVVLKVKKAVALENEKRLKKEKRVYDLPGQKHDPPEIRDPLRIFYETLYEKVPTSEMAAFWLMEWGLLPEREAKKVYEKKLGKKIVSPTKLTPVKKSSVTLTKKVSKITSKTRVKASKMCKVNDSKDDDNNEDDDDDFVPLKKTSKQK